MEHTACYLPGHPRPQFVRGDWRSLNGEWDFAFDDGNVGEEAGWYRDLPAARKIVVPYSYQTKASGIAETAHHPYLWYARTERYEKEVFNEKRLILHFEGCDYLTKVWVNGEYLGSHAGGYCRFSFDITDAVRRAGGTARVTVRAEDLTDATQPRGKQTWMPTPFGCWYHATGGIWKTVWTEFVGKSYLKSVKITPHFERFSVEFESVVAGYKPGLSLKTEIKYRGQLVASNTRALQRPVSNVTLDMTNDYDGFRVHTWDTKNPNLYDVEFTLEGDGKEADRVGSYFGFRCFYARGNALMLNQNPAYLKLILQQGYFPDTGLTAPSEEALIRDLTNIKELGFNGLRMHQKVEDERMYYYADLMGLMVWVEMPSAYEFKDATIDNLVPEWMEVVRQHYNHPSAVCWVPLNESWGVPRVLQDKRQQRLSEALYNLTKAYDETRPVVCNDGWEQTESDIVTLHNYCQSGEELARFYDKLDDVLAGKYVVDYCQWRLPFADGYGYRGQPVVISEYGGIGYESGSAEGWGYGSKVKSEREYLKRLAALTAALRANDGICGYCLTQYTDIEAEINGLYDIERRPKVDLAEIRKIVES